jgi:hypothetical protein
MPPARDFQPYSVSSSSMPPGVEAGPDRSAPKPASEEDVNRLAAEEQYKEVRLRNL